MTPRPLAGLRVIDFCWMIAGPLTTRLLADLGALGFREQRPLTRMYLGETRPPSEPAAEFAVFGPEFG